MQRSPPERMRSFSESSEGIIEANAGKSLIKPAILSHLIQKADKIEMDESANKTSNIAEITANSSVSAETKNTPINNKAATVKTGMYRYIQVKRKRSPQKTNSGEVAKKAQIDNVGQTRPLSNNRFALLSQPDAPKTTIVASKKPPPIYLREQSSDALVKNIATTIGKNNFHIVPISRGNIKETKIQVYTEDGYRAISKFFSENSKNFYTFQLKSSKGLQVVLKGIEPTVDSLEIKEALAEKGFEVKTVFNIFNRNKVPQSMFKVELAPDSRKLKKNETHPIYALQYLIHRKITVEEPHRRNGPVQCTNCQEFGHTKTYCTLRTVCVFCGDLHHSSVCKVGKAAETTSKKCSNCGENHTANYRGCPIYKALKTKLHEKISSKPVAIPQKISQNISSHVNPNISFANILKSNQEINLEPKNNNLREESLGSKGGIEAMITSLMHCMTNFMSGMQQMVQNLIASQNQMVQAFLSKK